VRNVPSEATWSFLYDTAAGIPAVLLVKHIDDKEDEYLTFFVREPGGELLASFESGGAARYYHFDALGSTVLLSDSSGNPAGAYAYGAWGDVLASPPSWQPYQYVGQLGYYTHTTSQGSELADWLQLGVRFYQPGLGRFGQHGSPYTYAGNQPMVTPASFNGGVTIGNPRPGAHRKWEECVSKCTADPDSKKEIGSMPPIGTIVGGGAAGSLGILICEQNAWCRLAYTLAGALIGWGAQSALEEATRMSYCRVFCQERLDKGRKPLFERKAFKGWLQYLREHLPDKPCVPSFLGLPPVEA